jgi:hypothetical protein
MAISIRRRCALARLEVADASLEGNASALVQPRSHRPARRVVRAPFASAFASISAISQSVGTLLHAQAMPSLGSPGVQQSSLALPQ